MIQMVGARVFKAYMENGVLISWAKVSAPNQSTAAATPPITVA